MLFNYGGFHNVYIHPNGNCDETGRILVGDTGGPASYTFSADDSGQAITFACDIGAHCESGQIISFQVAATTSGPTGPTMTPTASPTLLPSEDFKAGIDNDECELISDVMFQTGALVSILLLFVADDAILDVRSEVEWEGGRIRGATFADSLASFGSSTHTGAVPFDFAGCEFCTIAVYCRKCCSHLI